MGDAIGGHAQRDQTSRLAHSFIGDPVGELAPPLTTSDLGGNGCFPGVVGRGEFYELRRPPQRAIDPGLLAIHNSTRNELVRGAEHEFAYFRSGRRPVDPGECCLRRLSRKIHSDSHHWYIIRDETDTPSMPADQTTQYGSPEVALSQ